jgi:hypothetical protein
LSISTRSARGIGAISGKRKVKKKGLNGEQEESEGKK